MQYHIYDHLPQMHHAFDIRSHDQKGVLKNIIACIYELILLALKILTNRLRTLIYYARLVQKQMSLHGGWSTFQWNTWRVKSLFTFFF